MITLEKRRILAEEFPNNALIIMIGGSEQIRNGDIYYPFRQDSDFLLLTGADIPDLMLVGVKKNEDTKWTLYSDELSEKEKLWWSERISQDEIRILAEIEDIRNRKNFTKDIRAHLQNIENIYVKKGWTTDQKYQIRKLRLGMMKEKIKPFEPLLKPLRMIKTEEEIEKIRKAIRITHEAYDEIRANIKPEMYEYEVEAIVASVFRKHHVIEAYPTIVASGPNACTLHYTHHTRKIEAWDMVLVDFGAEYDGYAADITRVFQIPPWQGGKSEAKGGFDSRQLQVYNSVLSVKNYAESLIKPGAKKIEYERMVREKMNDELQKLGLIPDQSYIEEKERLSRKYYPHSTSHFLGLDVHDTGERDEILEAGMIITCEPWIYIPVEGIGIRLEDDILITESGCENLSKEIPI